MVARTASLVLLCVTSRKDILCHTGKLPGCLQISALRSWGILKGTPFEAYYVDHTSAVWPQAAGGIPFNACEFQSKGDSITDIVEDMAAEQKARTTYDNLIRLAKDDPDVLDPLKFLREREIVHFQRFGEALSIIQS